jgi:hypothetical protein
MMTTGVVLLGTTPASAQTSEHVSAKSSTTRARPPVLKKPQFTCHESGAIVVVKLRNRSRTVLYFEVRLSAGDYQEAQPMMLLPRGVDSVEFHGVPNGRYVTEVLNDGGDHVTQTRFQVRCKVKPTDQRRDRWAW